MLKTLLLLKIQMTSLKTTFVTQVRHSNACTYKHTVLTNLCL